ncbi:MAG: hypothetical protein V3U52_07900 [Thermoplasmata archaeon]
MKSFAVEGTVFWLIAAAILTGGSSYGPDVVLMASGLVFAVLYLVVAYFAWNHKKWAFIGAIILSVVSLIGSIAIGIGEGLTTGWEFFSGGGFLSVPTLLVIFFSLRAYREPTAG